MEKITSPPSLKFASFFSFITSHKAKMNIIVPCPQSPNMTENKNGNVMMVNSAEKIGMLCTSKM